jgi:hypothetical protein
VEERTENHDREFYITGPDHGLIAEAYEVPDALLIAAAPDLLAACEASLRLHSFSHEPEEMFAVAEMERAAIAKAKGES